MSNEMSIPFEFPDGFWTSEYQPDPTSNYNFDPETEWPEEIEVVDDGVLFHTPFGWSEA